MTRYSIPVPSRVSSSTVLDTPILFPSRVKIETFHLGGEKLNYPLLLPMFF